MTGLPTIPGSDGTTMSSVEIAELCDKRHDHVMRDIKAMLEALDMSAPSFGGSYLGDNGKQLPCFDLPRDLTMTLITGYSIPLRKRVVDRLDELEHRNARAMTPAEMFLHNAQAMVAIEREQSKQAQAIADIGATVARVETAQTVLRSRPANAEGITHIRVRIGKVHGLSSAVIDEVMRQSPYAPKPAGMVRNEHAEAVGSTYAIYWQKDITATFARFVDECEQVTATMFTHPYVEGRFRVASRAGVSHD